MSGPPQEPPPPTEPALPRDDLVIVEAGESRERVCADCGRRTKDWKPVRRHNASIILCRDCASKPPQATGDGVCPACEAALGPQDGFCGKCGARIEYACPMCAAALDADDMFCARCGARVA